MSKRHPIPSAKGHLSRSKRHAWRDAVRDWRGAEQQRIRDSQEEMRHRAVGETPSEPDERLK